MIECIALAALPLPVKLQVPPPPIIMGRLDVSSLSCKDVLLEIDAENGRLDTEAMLRGKPWQ